MTKKQQKEQNKKNRTLVLFNTGTRTHADKRKPSRAKQKQELRKEM